MNEFSQFIKIIGKGKRAGRYLTQQEAFRAFTLLLSRQAEPEQVGAFLMLLRMREESAEELAGFVQASRHFTKPNIASIQADLDLGCYAGKRRHLPWFVLAVLCLVQSGRKVFLHGCTEPESQRLYLNRVFQELGLPIAHCAADVRTQLQDYGFTYCDLRICNPELHGLIQMRELFGLRSPANTLARMLNPSGAQHSFHGVFHKHFDERHVKTAQLIGDAHVSCIRGEGGEVEVNPERPFDQFILDGGEIRKLAFPALLDKWQVKPKVLDCQELLQLWTGNTHSAYGEQAVTGTLASMLVLLDELTPLAAIEGAKSIWQSRNKRPFDFFDN